ncbi:MAG TPA: arginase family protein [Chryseolinea sp.]|nr:arginase family protein [Chryseolinea sp.]
MKYDIQIISAPSILGLKPSGVEQLSERLLGNGLREGLNATRPPIDVITLNELYTTVRDAGTNCINAIPVHAFSLKLGKIVLDVVEKKCFPLVLGGDCSILIGVMSALKRKSSHGLVFMDAHADFYEPEQSPTGELADMDLAIVTGRGPELLANIDQLQPYVKDEHVIHIGQRDHQETRDYQAADIADTQMYCVDAAAVQSAAVDQLITDILTRVARMKNLEGLWLHFDTDVLSDHINPAVDYRLPGGLSAHVVTLLLRRLLDTERIAGMSVTIYNPRLDANGQAGRMITDILVNAFGAVTLAPLRQE